MSTARVTLNRQSIIAVAAFFTILLATCAWGLSFMIANRELQGEFETKTRVLEELNKRAVAPGVIDRTTAEDLRDAAISAPTETLAASELHRRILATLEGNGGVHSIQTEATTETIGDGLKRVNAQVAFDSSMESLQKVLFHFETVIPFVFVELDFYPAGHDAGPRRKNWRSAARDDVNFELLEEFGSERPPWSRERPVLIGRATGRSFGQTIPARLPAPRTLLMELRSGN